MTYHDYSESRITDLPLAENTTARIPWKDKRITVTLEGRERKVPLPKYVDVAHIAGRQCARTHRFLRKHQYKVWEARQAVMSMLPHPAGRVLADAVTGTSMLDAPSRYQWGSLPKLRRVVPRIIRQDVAMSEEEWKRLGRALAVLSDESEEVYEARDSLETYRERSTLAGDFRTLAAAKRKHYFTWVVENYTKVPKCAQHLINFEKTHAKCGVSVETDKYKGRLESWAAEWSVAHNWVSTVLKAGIAVPKVNHIVLAAEDMGTDAGIRYWKATWARPTSDWDMRTEEGSVGMRDGRFAVSKTARNIPRLLDEGVSRDVLGDIESLMGSLG